MNSDAVKSSAVSTKGSPMQALALKGAARRWIAKLHRWSGLALLAFLLIAGITVIGLIFFGPELSGMGAKVNFEMLRFMYDEFVPRMPNIEETFGEAGRQLVQIVEARVETAQGPIRILTGFEVGEVSGPVFGFRIEARDQPAVDL